MKKIFLLFLAVSLFTNCSKDESINNSLDGKWEFSKSYINYYNKDRQLIKTLNVRNFIDNDKELFHTDEAVIYMKAVEFGTNNKCIFMPTWGKDQFITSIYSISKNIIDFDGDEIKFEYRIENGVLITDNRGSGEYFDLVNGTKPSEYNNELREHINPDYKYWRMFVEYRRSN